MVRIWRNFSIFKKLVSVVLLIISLIAIQLVLIFGVLEYINSAQTLLVGEGTWTKSQKDAVLHLYQYVNIRDNKFLEKFKNNLVVIDGDAQARTELSKDEFDYNVVRDGFIKGGIPSNEIDGIIKLLIRFRKNMYIAKAIEAWTNADKDIALLKDLALQIEITVPNSQNIESFGSEILRINEKLTQHERNFSSAILSGTVWMKDVFKYLLVLFILFFDGIGVLIVFKLGRDLINTLKYLNKIAIQVGDGNFDLKVPIHNKDELGELSLSINRMIVNLQKYKIIRNRTEESLRRSNERFSTLVEAVKEYAIFSLDINGYVQSWNSGAEHLYGYFSSEIIGKHFSIFYANGSFDSSLMERMSKANTLSQPFEGEVKCIKKDASEFWGNVSLTIRVDSESKLIGFALVTRDVSEKKKNEINLKSSNLLLERSVADRTKELLLREYQLKHITNALPESICQVGLDERILFVNEAFCRTYRQDRTQVIGRSLVEVFSGKFYRLFEKPIQQVLKGKVTTFEGRLVGDNQDLHHQITLVPDHNGNGEIISFVLVAHDIKTFKEIEFELIKSKELADVANKTKSAFLANMSHEIRTPLGAVLGYSDLLVNEKLPDQQRLNIVDALKRNGELLSNVINDILDLSKVEAGKLEIEKVNVLFDDVIKDIESLLVLKASEKGLKLKVTTEEKMPILIKTDPLRLRQILLNIIGNAIKFTEDGFVSIHVKVVSSKSAKGSSKIVFVVEDSGKGMTEEQAQKIFAPFSQADVSTTRKYGGSGLGLALSKKLAAALGGDVVLKKTELGQGSTFEVSLEIGHSNSSTFDDYEQNKNKSIIKKPVIAYDFTKLKILLVEDSLDNQVIVSHFLKSTGALIKVANNGQEGLKMALGEQFDLVLLDLQMPIMGGFDTLQKLQEAKFGSPVIALTAHAMNEDRKKCLAAGFKDHLGKPINREMLLRMIFYWTSHKSRIDEFRP